MDRRSAVKREIVGETAVVRGVPLKTDPAEMADRLLKSGDRETALKRAKEEMSLARRSRSRHRYNYWAAVDLALKAAQ